METVLYEDFNTAHNNFLANGMNNINQLKRKLTLDLDLGSSDGSASKPIQVKKAKVTSLNTPLPLTTVNTGNTVNGSTTLQTPDVNKLALGTPELERLIVFQASMLPTPTFDPTRPDRSIFFPKNVTEEQEAYAQGFTEALSKLHNAASTGPLITNNNTVLTTTATSNNVNMSLASSMVNTSTIQTLSNGALPQESQFHLLQNVSNNNNIVTSMNSRLVPPPPAYYDQDSSDVSEDTMSESSCSNSTSSSTYATNPMVVPTSSMLNNSAHAAFPSVVSSASSIIPHRLPDYGMTPVTLGGSATGSSGNIAAIPVSSAGYSQASNSPIPVLIKEEPQTVPNVSSPNPVTPIDMETQEQIKLERKRQRNRLAASKCRRRKLERIAKLEDKVKQLKGENAELTTVLNKLKDTVCSLKQQVMDHVQSGCQIMIPSNLTAGF